MSIKDLFLRDVEETPTPEVVPVSGHLPIWLEGTYYKIGNGKYTLPSGFQMNHMFDGYCIIFQYKIEQNKISLRSKYLNSDAYNEAMQFGKPTHAEFGTRQFANPNKNIVKRAISTLLPTDLSDNTCANIFTYRDKLYVNNEGCFMHQIDPVTLQSAAKIDLRKSGVLSVSGHFMHDGSGAIYNAATNVSKSGATKMMIKCTAPAADETDNTFNPKKHVKIVSTVSLSSMTSISHCHSFGMSENYYIIIEQPLKLNFFSFVAGQLKGKPIMDCIHWNPEEMIKFHVIERATGKLINTKYIAAPFWFLHIINSYEEDDCLIIDIITYKNSAIISSFLMCRLKNNEINKDDPGMLKRFVLPIKNIKIKMSENLVKLNTTTATAIRINDETISLSPENLFDVPAANLKFNPNFIAKKYRYLYSFVVFLEHKYQKQLCKLDLETKEVKIWKSSNDAHFASEPLFVPNPNAEEEDDGVIISVVVEAGTKKSLLLFLDAKTFTEIARAQFTSDVFVGNHGLFVFKN